MIKVYVDPWSDSLLNNGLFEVNESNNLRIDYLLPFIYLRNFCRENGILIETIDKLPEEKSLNNKYLYVSFGQLCGYNKISDRKDIIFLSFYLFEPPIKTLPKKLDIHYSLPKLKTNFKKVYTTSPVSAINLCYKTHFKFETSHFCYPQSYNGPLEKYWNVINRKLLVMVNSYRYSRLHDIELYSERIVALKFLLPKGAIDLYGKDWDRLSSKIIINSLKIIRWTLKWANIRRVKDFLNTIELRKYLRKAKPVYDKYLIYSKYKFAICYESMEIEGFMTEKIFDCFFAGTIPIYLGDPTIENRIPSNTFINKRNYKSYEDLLNYLENMSNVEYETYRNNIKSFLNSKKFEPFTMHHFAQNFVGDVLEILNHNIEK